MTEANTDKELYESHPCESDKDRLRAELEQQGWVRAQQNEQDWLRAQQEIHRR